MASKGFHVDGMPEGIEVVRWGEPLSQQFYWDGGIQQATRGAILGHFFVLEPSEGYEFIYDPTWHRFEVAKKYNAPVKLTATFVIQNDLHERYIRLVCSACPGFVEIVP